MARDLNGTAEQTDSYEYLSPTVNRIGGRFEVGERLGVGGMSEVFLAHDLRSGSDVAIKFMKAELSGSARRRFFREFNTIAGIKHPCCLQVFEIGETERGPYFTMELHPGRNASSILGEPPKIVAPPLVDLTLAIDYIHSQGIVHRDVKPSNIMVERTGSVDDGKLTCKLADFGLAKFYQLDSSLTNERGIVGTPAYCAPEQIDGFDVDHRVDLYAIGLLAYEMLSGGKHPFARARAEGMNALLHAQLRTQPPPLRQVNPNISETLSNIVDSYIAKEPEARPSSGAAMRKVLCAEYGITVEERLEELSSPSEVVLNAVGFVCREPELKQVDNFLSQTPSAKAENATAESLSAMLLFSGDSGTGKTSTMQEAMRRATGRGYYVYEGRCFDGSTSTLQPVVTIVRHILSSYARNQRTVEESTLLADYQAANAELEKMFNVLLAYRDELLLISPDLRRWLSGNRELPAQDNDPNYLLNALSQMFLELSDIVPLCICIEDLQWADHTTLSFLKHLAVSIAERNENGRPAESRLVSLLMMGTARSSYTKTDDLRTKLQTQRLLEEVSLAPLNRRETRELIALRLGCLAPTVTDELVDAIDRLCNGNPFFISETIREWHTRGFIVQTADGWQRVHGTIDDESSLPSTIRSAMKMRITELSSETQEALNIAAVIGRVIDLDLLEEACESLSEVELLDAVDDLLSSRILAETNSANRVTFAHDLLRESILTELSAGRRRAVHRNLASILMARQERRGDVPEATLARHFLEGGQESEAFAQFVSAAARAAETYAFFDALEYTKAAKQIIPSGADSDELYCLYEAETRSAFNTADVATAQESGETALRHAHTALQKARIMLLLARIQTSMGDATKSVYWHDAALKALGVMRPTSRIMQLLLTQYNFVGFHALPEPLLRILNRSKQNEETHTLACEVMYSLSHVLVCGDLLAYTQVCTSNIRIARSLSNHAAKAFSYAKYGLNLGFSGANRPLTTLSRRARTMGIRYAQMGQEEAQLSQRAHVEAAAGTSLALAYYTAGKLNDAAATLESARRILDKVRDLHAAFRFHAMRHVASIRGQPDLIIEHALQELATAEGTGAAELLAWANFGLAHGYSLAGRFDEAVAAGKASIPAANKNQSNFAAVAQMELGSALMHAGDYAAAIETFNAAYAFIKKRMFFFEVAMPLFPRLAEAHLGPNWLDGASDTCKPRNAKASLRMARFMSVAFPNICPVTSRIIGRMQHVLGNSSKAEKYFKKSLTQAQDLGARYDHARALIDYGLAFPAKSSLVQDGCDILKELGAVLPKAEQADLASRLDTNNSD